MPETVKICDLQKGEYFVRLGYKYVVIEIDPRRGIKYRCVSGVFRNGHALYIGCKSQEKVIKISKQDLELP